MMNFEEQICSQLYRHNGVSIQNCSELLRSYRRHKERKSVLKFACDFLDDFLDKPNLVLRYYVEWLSKPAYMSTLDGFICKDVFDKLTDRFGSIDKYIRKRYGWLPEELPFH